MNFKNKISHFIGRHRFLSRKLRQFQPDFSQINISNNFSLFLDPKDLYGPSYYVMYDQGAAFYHYEEELKADIVQYLPRNGVFFDVGANIGIISFFIRKFYPDVSIHAFEPGKTVSRCIEKTLEFNKTKKFVLVKKGIADHKGVAEFFIDPKSTGGSSITRKHVGKNNNNIERIELISLDEYVLENGIVPSLIKVDVEGAENLVIKGARNLIQKHRPVLIIECDNKNILSNLQLWSEVFEGYNFRIVGKQNFSSVKDLEKVITDNMNQGLVGVDYLFVPAS